MTKRDTGCLSSGHCHVPVVDLTRESCCAAGRCVPSGTLAKTTPGGTLKPQLITAQVRSTHNAADLPIGNHIQKLDFDSPIVDATSPLVCETAHNEEILVTGVLASRGGCSSEKADSDSPLGRRLLSSSRPPCHALARRTMSVNDTIKTINAALKNAQLPDEVVRWQIQLRPDWTDEPAVYVWLLIDDAVWSREWSRKNASNLTSIAREAIHSADIGRWPYVGIRTVAEQREIEEVEPKP